MLMIYPTRAGLVLSVRRHATVHKVRVPKLLFEAAQWAAVGVAGLWFGYHGAALVHRLL